MELPIRHRNITVKRLLLDLYQFLRAQSFVVKHFGRQFEVSREYAEIDITYQCNLKCINCNRSCTQAPSSLEISVAEIQAFLRQSIESNVAWRRIRLLGGEPTLHSRIFEILELLTWYQEQHNPSVRLVLGTNFFGKRVQCILEKIPRNFTLKSTLKTSRRNLFKPFNLAPRDTFYNRFSDYSCGCRIIADCGLGVTPLGYYMCAVAGGIDRIFQWNLGRKRLPDQSDTLTDQMSVFCSICGHFGFSWPTRKVKMSATWRKAYEQYKIKPDGWERRTQ